MSAGAARSPASGFSLFELLLVVGLIAMFVGLAGYGLRSTGRGNEIAGSQALLNTMVSAARLNASAAQNRALLLVAADPDSEDFLRRLLIVVETAPASDRWIEVGTEVRLPETIRVVPGTAQIVGASFAPDWPATRHSSAILGSAPATLDGNSEGSLQGLYLRVVGFEPNGTLALSSAAAALHTKLIVAPATRTPDGVHFSESAQARGILLSSYGLGTLIDDATGFDR